MGEQDMDIIILWSNMSYVGGIKGYLQGVWR